MLSLKELKREVPILERRLMGSTLQRIVQTDDLRLALLFRQREFERALLLCCQPDFARISALREMPQSPVTVPSFTQFMRAHVVHAAFGGAKVADTDRQVTIRLLARDGPFELILSILGSRSNIYLLGPEGGLAHAMRPLEETRNELELGAPWSNPEGALRTEGVDRWEMVRDEEYPEEIERHYVLLERARRFESLARKIEASLNKESGFLDRKAINLQEDLGEAQQAEGYRRKGELIKGVLHLIRAGDASIDVYDHATGESVTIPLDPTLSSAQNLEAYFRRYQKELRGAAAIEQQLGSVRYAQTELEKMRAELQVILAAGQPDLEALEAFSAQPRIRRLIGRYRPQPRPASSAKPSGGKRSLPGRLLPKRYRTSDGLEVWVGRNDESNDYLTTRLSRGNDLFFHLEGYPGSHVILRTEGRTDPPPESILEACELAVHFSKLKNAGRADVHVAYIKDVKKPKGVKKGLVYVTRGRTVHLRRDPRRLENVLSSRLDE